MESRDIFSKVAEVFGNRVEGFNEEGVDPCFKVRSDSIVEVCRFLRDDQDLAFEVLSDLTALDLPKDNIIQVVYHLYSYTKRHQIVLKADLPREGPALKTVEGVWRAANWMEREVFDLFGVVFEGHPDLRRIMLPEDWVGHPLRKDFVEQEQYDGISTSREPLVLENLR